MLKKTKSIFSGNAEEENIILEGSTFNGSIITEGTIKVMGKINGTRIKADKIYIKPNAMVKGNLEVNNLNVEGVYIGDAKVEVRVILFPTSKVASNIVTKEMITSDGVTFQGNCKVSNENLNEIDKYVQELFNQKTISE